MWKRERKDELVIRRTMSHLVTLQVFATFTGANKTDRPFIQDHVASFLQIEIESDSSRYDTMRDYFSIHQSISVMIS